MAIYMVMVEPSCMYMFGGRRVAGCSGLVAW